MGNEWTNTLLDEKRKHGDPRADKAAAALFELIAAQDTDEKRKAVSKFITEFVSHDFVEQWDQDKHSIKIPKDLLDYFEDMSPFTFTHEEKRILERGSDFFDDHGPKVILILYGRSLLKQYSHTKAIQVLRMTTLLRDHVHRRIIETMQFVVDVMKPDWHKHDKKSGDLILNTNHDGIQSIQKLRLVHAMIRYKINHKMTRESEGLWNDEWGFPINQEDMIFATHTFSIEVLQGLQELGAKLTDQEINDYYQTWSLIGRALGVDQDLIPANYETGVQLQNKIYERHFTLPNEHGPHLAKALVAWIDSIVPLFNEQTALTIIKEVNGPKNTAMIKTHLGLDVTKAHENFAEHLNDINLPGSKHAKPRNGATYEMEHLFIYFMNNLLKVERGGKGSTFRIGDGFAESWNINQDLEKPPSDSLFQGIWIFIKTLFLKIIGYFKKNE